MILLHLFVMDASMATFDMYVIKHYHGGTLVREKEIRY